MKVLLDIRDDKAEFVMEVLSNFEFVKTNPISPTKAELIEGFKEAVTQVNLAKKGGANLKSAHQLLDEV